MKILGLPIPFTGQQQKALNAVDHNRGGWMRIFESFAGAWQHNVEVDYNSVLSFHADFACKTLIASDVAKLRVKLVQRDTNRIWTEVDNRNYQVLVKPNHFQTRIQFFENWMISKLQRGNAVVLKQRNRLGGVEALYVLDWQFVEPLVADNGDVFYRLKADNLAGINENIVVPAREIIHDRFNCLFHPLVGLSPIYAGGLAAMQGLKIQEQSTKFFANGARPSGVLTAPGAISVDTAVRLKEAWDTKFGGENAGKVAVLGDGLKYEPMTAKAVDAQLIEQLKWSAEVVCSVYHVPPYKVGVGAMPTNNNVQALNIEYYSQCLQAHIESIELLLDEGLGLRGESGNGASLGTEFDIDNLLRMDTISQMEALDKARNYLTPDEGRRRLNLPPTDGGNVVYRQQQDYSLAALAKRDAKDDPFAKGNEAPAANDNAAEEQRRLLHALRKGLS